MQILLSAGIWILGWGLLAAFGSAAGMRLRRVGSDETDDFIELTSKITGSYFKEALFYTVLSAISYFLRASFPAVAWIAFAIAAIGALIQVVITICAVVTAFRGKLNCAASISLFALFEVALEIALVLNLLNLAR